MAGPAYCAAAVPVRTKMPAPMIAPMPRRVRLRAPSDRLRECSPSSDASLWRNSTLFLDHKPMRSLRDRGFGEPAISIRDTPDDDSKTAREGGSEARALSSRLIAFGQT